MTYFSSTEKLEIGNELNLVIDLLNKAKISIFLNESDYQKELNLARSVLDNQFNELCKKAKN